MRGGEASALGARYLNDLHGLDLDTNSWFARALARICIASLEGLRDCAGDVRLGSVRWLELRVIGAGVARTSSRCSGAARALSAIAFARGASDFRT